MNGNSGIKMEGIHVADLANRKKPKMKKVTIRVEVEDEKGQKVSGFREEEWLASVSVHEIIEFVMEAIIEIE